MVKIEEKLDFVLYVKKFYPYYKIDQHNQYIVEQLSLYAARDVRFEKTPAQFLGKGICLLGPVGTGKTDLIILLGNYFNSHLKSPLAFQPKKVEKFTPDFEKDGYAAFAGEHKKNKLYDDLCLIDSRNERPIRELATHYKTTILVGEEIIMLRSEVFKFQGLITHFTSNANKSQLKDIYGERAWDRLREMCNFFTLAGESRRGGREHKFSDINNPQMQAPLRSEEDYLKESMAGLEQSYQYFLEDRSPLIPLSLVYNSLAAFLPNLAPEEGFDTLEEHYNALYIPQFGYQKKSRIEQAEDKRAWVWDQVRSDIVKKYFAALKAAGRTSLFDDK